MKNDFNFFMFILYKMTSYLPPLENLPTFNSSLFNQAEDTLSQAEADLLYLSKKKSDTSTAPLTTFNGQVNIGGTTTITDGQVLNTRQINSTSTASTAHQLFTNMIAPAVLTIGNSASSNTLNGATTLNQQATFNNFTPISSVATPSAVNHLTRKDYVDTNFVDRTNTLTQNINGLKTFTNNVEINNATRASLILTTSSTNYSNVEQIGPDLRLQNLSPVGGSVDFLFANNSQFTVSQGRVTTAAAVQFTTKLIKSIPGDLTGTHTLFDDVTGGTLTIGGTNTPVSIRGNASLPQDVVIGGTVSIGGIITLNASSYSFPLPSNKNLGYYYQETGASYNVSSVFSPETIFNTSITIPVGIWRIDFTIETTCIAAGTISAAQSYVSLVQNQPLSSAVPYLGAVIRSTVPKVFALNEVDLMISSFTYYQTTAGQVRITVARTYTGTYGIVGAMAFTRIG